MATKRTSKASKSSKNRKRIPSVKRLEGVRSLQMKAASILPGCSAGCDTR